MAIAGSAILVLFLLISSSGPVETAVLQIAVLFCVLSTALWWVGRTVLAAWTLVGSGWFVLAVEVLVNGGLSGVHASGFVTMVLLTSLVGGARGALLGALAAMVVSASIGRAEVLGWLPPVGPVASEPAFVLVRLVGNLVLVTLILAFGMGAVRRAIAQAHAAEQRAEDRAEELAQQSTLLDQVAIGLPGILLVADTTAGRFTYVSQAWTRLTGQPVGVLTADPLLIAEHLDVPTQRRTAGALTQIEAWPREIGLLGRDGGVVHHAVKLSRRDPETGQVAVVLTDMTQEILQREQEVVAAQALDRATQFEALGRLSGGVAHDLRNLLQVVQAFSGLVMAVLPSEDPAREELKAIDEATNQAAEITSELLEFSVREGPEGPFVLDDRVRSTMRLLRRLLPASLELRMALAVPGVRVSEQSQTLDLLLFCLAADAIESEVNTAIELVTREAGDEVVLSCIAPAGDGKRYWEAGLRSALQRPDRLAIETTSDQLTVVLRMAKSE